MSIQPFAGHHDTKIDRCILPARHAALAVPIIQPPLGFLNIRNASNDATTRAILFVALLNEDPKARAAPALELDFQSLAKRCKMVGGLILVFVTKQAMSYRDSGVERRMPLLDEKRRRGKDAANMAPPQVSSIFW